MAQEDDTKPTATDDMSPEGADEASESVAGRVGGGGGSDAAQREIADLKAKLIRWQADFQNLQRRAAVEVLESRRNADADFAKSMVQVLDHFDMALSVDPTKVDAKGLLDGVKITYDELRKVLANRGIETYDPTGKLASITHTHRSRHAGTQRQISSHDRHPELFARLQNRRSHPASGQGESQQIIKCLHG